MTSVALNENDRLRRKRDLTNQRRRAIILQKGPTHPEFGHAFMRYYLPHYCIDETLEPPELVAPADWHPVFFETVFAGLGKGEFHAHLAPRGWAKSTIVTVAMSLAVLGLSGLAIQGKLPYRFRVRHYLWIVQDTAPQAKQSMDAILAETEGNPRLRADFPHLVPMLGRHKRPVADRDDDVVFELGLRLQALGAGQKIRGRRHRQHRPDLLLIDDLENDEQVLTRYQRNKTDSWLSGALVPALAKGADAHMVGTLLHHDAVLSRIMKRSGWRSHRYEALRKEEEPCPDHGWRVDPEDESDPECDLCLGTMKVRRSTWGYRDAYWHAQARKRMGRSAYNREVLHKVVNEEEQMFTGVQYEADSLYTPERLRENGWRVRIGVDVGLTENQRNDPSAIVVVAKRRGERKHVVVAASEMWMRGTKLKQRIMSTWETWGGTVVFESTQAQVWGAEALQDEGIPVDPVKPSKDKVSRAEPVSLKYEQSQYVHVESLRDSRLEQAQIEFPEGDGTHLVDALVHADKGLSVERGAGVTGSVGGGTDDEKAGPVDDGVWTPDDPRYA